MAIDLKTQLTPNFRLGEFFATNQAGGQAGLLKDFYALTAAKQAVILSNLKRLAERLEEVRTLLGGRAIRISSGWRSARINKLVDGATSSQHLLGKAADLQIYGLTPKEVQAALDAVWLGGMELVVGWTHLDIGPKRRFKP